MLSPTLDLLQQSPGEAVAVAVIAAAVAVAAAEAAPCPLLAVAEAGVVAERGLQLLRLRLLAHRLHEVLVHLRRARATPQCTSSMR